MSEYGKGKAKFSEKQLKKFIQCLITKRILDEQLPPSNDKCTTPNICIGRNADKLRNNEEQFIYFR